MDASLLHTIFACIGTPMPMIALVLMQELVPLQDSREEWRANYGYWIRELIVTCVGTRIFIVQAIYFFRGVEISMIRQLLVSICTAVSVTVCSMILSDKFVFPFPFYSLTVAPASYVLMLTSFWLIVGTRVIREMIGQRGRLIQFMSFASAQFMLFFLHPAYEALFRLAEGSRYELPVILVLPILKVLVRNVALRCVARMEDMAPAVVMFTVDFFNVMYMATCMQTASSISAIAAITFADISQTGSTLYGLHQRTYSSFSGFCPAKGKLVDCCVPLVSRRQTIRKIRQRRYPHSLLPYSSPNDSRWKHSGYAR